MMSNAARPHRLGAALYGAGELTALLFSGIAVLSIGGDGLDKMAAAFIFMVTAPVAVVIGAILGTRSVRSTSSWGFARPRQVIISVLFACLFLGLNLYSYEIGLIKKPIPLTDPLANTSHGQIVSSLSDPRPENRVSAAEELVRRHDPAAGDLLLPLLQDPNGHVRGRAAVLLGQIRDKRAVDKIVGLLDDPEYGTQLDAIRSLGEIGDSRAVVSLLAVLARPHSSGVVAEALAKIGDHRAIGPLIDFLETSSREDQLQFRKWVIESLEKLSGQHFGDDMASWRQWYEADTRK